MTAPTPEDHHRRGSSYDDAHTLDALRGDRRLRGPARAPSSSGPTQVVERGEDGQPARPGRRRLPGRREVGLLPAGRVAPLPRRQRRRERAGHLQGPPPHGARSAPAHRGHPHRLLRGRVRAGVPLRPGRDGAGPGAHRRRPQRGLRRRLRRARTSSAPTSPSTSSCTGAPAPTSSARRRRSSRASRATGACRGSSRRSSRRPRASTCSRRSSTTSRRCPTCRGSSPTAAPRSPRSAPRRAEGTRMFAVSGHVQNPGVYEVEFGVTTFRDLHLRARPTAAASATAASSRRSSPAARRRPWFFEEHLDLPLEAGAVGKAGSMLGSGAIVVMDETTDMVKAAPAARALLRPRVVRQVHAVPRGHELAGEDPRAHPRRPRPARATSTCCSTSATTSARRSPGRRSRPRSARSARRRCRRSRRRCMRFRDEFEAYIGGPAARVHLGQRRGLHRGPPRPVRRHD